MDAVSLVWFLGVSLLVSLSGVHGNLVLYPHAPGVHASNKFQVFVSQSGSKKSSFTYISLSDVRVPDSKFVHGGRSVSWTSFAFTGHPVTVEVHTQHDFQKCVVRPKSYGFHCRRTGAKTAQFKVTSNNRMMSVEFDNDYGSGKHDILDKLLVFADAPETRVPGKHAQHVLYYDVGVHNLQGQLALSGDTREVYLAPGAFVQGGFITKGNHPVKIHGRGILSGSLYKWHDHRFLKAMVNMEHGSGHTLEGITIADPEQFFYAGASNSTVQNVKMVAAWTHNSDGIQMHDNGLVQDTFIMANDDSLKITGDYMTIRRCVVWQSYNGAVFQFGWFPKRDTKGIRVSDVDVIHTDWCAFKGDHCHFGHNDAVFDLAGTHQLQFRDFRFRDVRVEGWCPRLLNFAVKEQGSGSVSDFLFQDVWVEAQPTHDSYHNVISGQPGARVSNWRFVNLTVGGQCVGSPRAGDFQIDGHTTSNIHFECKGGGHPHIVGK